jgi:hypothetical protein
LAAADEAAAPFIETALGCFDGFGFLALGLSGHDNALPPLSDLQILHAPPI